MYLSITKFRNRKVLYHLITLFTVSVWGITFVSTKKLIYAGMTPIEIFFVRFLIAYVCIAVVAGRKLFASSWKDEGLMFLSGLSGGSLYFITENTALEFTQASNVSLLICVSPIFTLILSHIFLGTKLGKLMVVGSFLALFGVGMVVLNGNVMMKLNPMGDLLTLCAAMLWAVYCIILKRLSAGYKTAFITRKVFFYGVVSVVPYIIITHDSLQWDVFKEPVVYGNILFLALVASMLCFFLWNIAVKELGSTVTANYIYLTPMITMAAAAVFLGETLDVVFLAGALCIIGGVYIVNHFD